MKDDEDEEDDIINKFIFRGSDIDNKQTRKNLSLYKNSTLL